MDSTFVLLKSIQDGSWATQHLSLLIALLAVFFGPIMSYFAAKLTLRSQLTAISQQISTQTVIAERTIKSQVISANRQQWINTLRDTISEFVSLVWMFSAALVTTEKPFPEFQRLTQVRTKISLLLNPTEEDHKQLEDLLSKSIQQIAEEVKKGKVGEGFFDLRDQITVISQKILKREWERVKSIE